jgi:hypothetical protein
VVRPSVGDGKLRCAPLSHILDDGGPDAGTVVGLDAAAEPAEFAVEELAQRFEDGGHKVTRRRRLALDAGRAVLRSDRADEPKRVGAALGEDGDDDARQRLDKRTEVAERDGISVWRRDNVRVFPLGQVQRAAALTTRVVLVIVGAVVGQSVGALHPVRDPLVPSRPRARVKRADLTDEQCR